MEIIKYTLLDPNWKPLKQIDQQLRKMQIYEHLDLYSKVAEKDLVNKIKNLDTSDEDQKYVRSTYVNNIQGYIKNQLIMPSKDCISCWTF